jgi:hypothetical protein
MQFSAENGNLCFLFRERNGQFIEGFEVEDRGKVESCDRKRGECITRSD